MTEPVDRGNELASLAAFMRAAEALRTEGPDAATEQRHLAEIAAETARLRVAAPPVPSERGSTMLGVLRSRWFKGTAIGVAAVLATGGLAAARVLPAPAQNAIAAAADAIGIDLPRADDQNASDFDGDGISNGEDPTPGEPLTTSDAGRDADGDGISNGEDPEPAKVKDGLDHDGDGVPDDSGNHGRPDTPPGQETAPNAGKPEKPDTPPGASKTPRPERTPKSPDTGPPDDAPENDNGNEHGADEQRQTGPPDGAGKPEKPADA